MDASVAEHFLAFVSSKPEFGGGCVLDSCRALRCISSVDNVRGLW